MISSWFFRPWLVGLLLLGGCATERGNSMTHYYRVEVTDPRGYFVSSWIALGRVHPTDRGYRFRAIERHTAPPFPQDIRYPDGRLVDAVGANIRIVRCDEPWWHYQQHH